MTEVQETEAKDTNVSPRYRLLARAQLHGAIREPGYVFTLAEGEIGPHRTVVASNHGAQITDHMNADEKLFDEPLFEEIQEPDPIEAETAKRRALEDRIQSLRKQLEEAEAEFADLDRDPAKPLLLEKPQSNLPARG